MKNIIYTFIICCFIGCKQQKDQNAPKKPSEILDLSYWKLNIPLDEDQNGKPDAVKVKELNSGFAHPDYFHVSDDGGVVFSCPIQGPATTPNSKYMRTELREMLRGENKKIKTKSLGNNWVFSTAPEEDRKEAGATDGQMKATLAINHVTTTGIPKQVGTVTIGQIHANKSEPIKLFYRKLPEHKLGSVYYSHETTNGENINIPIIGSLKNKTESDEGIALNEVFSYNIKVTGNDLYVSLDRPNHPSISKYYDMSASGYDAGGQYQYFKAGVYNINNSGDPNDYVQATFYDLKVTH